MRSGLGSITIVSSRVTNCSAAATKNGTANPKRAYSRPPPAGPKTMPAANMAPIKPKARARSFGATRSATYACVMLMFPPEIPSMIRAAKTTAIGETAMATATFGATPSSAQPMVAPIWLTISTILRPIRSEM